MINFKISTINDKMISSLFHPLKAKKISNPKENHYFCSLKYNKHFISLLLELKNKKY